MRKELEDCNNQISKFNGKQFKIQKQVDEMNVTILRTLKNTDMDNNLLNWEITRMQHIDRLKTIHANDVFYNADNGSMLPSLDTCHGTISDNNPHFASPTSLQTSSRNNAITPAPRDYGQMNSAGDVIT